MTTFYLILAVIAAGWAFSVIASLCAFRWGAWPIPGRLWAAISLAVFALVISYLGLTRFNVSYSKTVNGSHWGIQSKWFFLVPLLLGALALVLVIRNRKRLGHAA